LKYVFSLLIITPQSFSLSCVIFNFFTVIGGGLFSLTGAFSGVDFGLLVDALAGFWSFGVFLFLAFGVSGSCTPSWRVA
jgi:hypothetical protein